MEEILPLMDTGAVKAPVSPQLPSLAGADDWKLEAMPDIIV
jgi:hypothetical protein